MASGISVMTKALDIKGMHIDRVSFTEGSVHRWGEEYSRAKIDLVVRPYKRIQQRCPHCGRKLGIYDHKDKKSVSWRANSLNGIPVYLHYQPRRVECPEHGVLTEYMPWTDDDTRSTEGFNNEVAFLAMNAPKTVVSQFMDINWRTVGNCLKAAHDRIEPDVSQRLRGLKRICVDETSRQKGHKYITVVYDLDRNRVAWIHDGNGLEIFSLFCEALTKEEQEAIEVVAGDGAKWIDQCCQKYFVNARRCVDFFHVVSWTTEAMDKVRLGAQHKASRDLNKMQETLEKQEKEETEAKDKARKEYARVMAELKTMKRPSKKKKELEEYLESLRAQLEGSQNTANQKVVTEEEYRVALEELQTMPKRGRPSKRKAELLTIIAAYEGTDNNGNKKKCKLNPEHQRIIDEMRRKAEDIKGTKYALGMNPENLNDSMRDKLKILEGSYPEVYKAHEFKERLRIILHMKDAKTAEIELDKWIKETEDCGLKPFVELSAKIQRHRENILNSVELQVNSSKSEATNTTIKALIKMARGFRNLDNMMALIYLRCSDLVVPLNNRYQPTAEKQQELRDIANERRRKREEERRSRVMQA